MRGVSEMKRMTPAAVEEQLRRAAGPLPRAGGAGGGDLRQPARRARGRARASRPSGSTTYDGLDNVVDRADEITGKKGESLREHLGDVIRNRQLNALVCDLDLPLVPTDLAMRPWDRQEVHTLFDGLEFRVLRDRLFETLESEEEIDDSGFALDMTRLEPGEVAGWLAEHASTGERVGVARRGLLGVAAPATCRPWRSPPPTAAAAHVVVETLTPEDDAAIVAWFGDPEQPKVLHDAKGPMLALAARGWPLLGLDRDTALSAYLARPGPALLRPGRPDRALPQARAQAGDRATTASSASTASTTATAAARPPMLHASAVLDLAAALDDELADRGGTGLLADVELPLIDVLARMEQVGIAVDHELLEELEEGFADRVRDAAEAAYAVIGKEINLGSPKQLQVVLFDELRHAEDQAHQDRLHHRRRRAAGALREDRAPVPRAPAASTATRSGCARPSRGCSRPSAEDGRIHTTFNQLIAATGRLSSTDPNLQNIPVRTEAGRRIREGVRGRQRATPS